MTAFFLIGHGAAEDIGPNSPDCGYRRNYFTVSENFRIFAIAISRKSIVDIHQIAFAIYSEHSKLGSFINQLRISQ